VTVADHASRAGPGSPGSAHPRAARSPAGGTITVLHMSDAPDQPPVPDAAPTPTTVVGYPAAPTASAAAYASPGVASLRSQVRAVRYLVLACLALLVVLAVGLGVALAGSRAQLDDLSAQVSALSEQAAAAAVTPSGEQRPSAEQEPVATQLGAASDLEAGVPMPDGVDPTGAVLIGDPDAANVVEVYIDYQCPFCQRWEEGIGTPLATKALQPGSDLLIKQYNLAFLGETSPTLTPAGASARAASAAACVVNHDGVETFVDFSQAVFAAADPSEPPSQFTAAALTELASAAGASADSITCIEGEDNVPFVAATTKAGFGRGVGGTPTVIVNGQTLANPFTDPALEQLLASG
jgi:protein-disulfide isomerase